MNDYDRRNIGSPVLCEKLSDLGVKYGFKAERAKKDAEIAEIITPLDALSLL